MKLMRIGQPGHERPAALDAEGKVRDLSGHVEDIAGEAITPHGIARLQAIDLASLPEVEADRIGPCWRRWQVPLYRSQLCRSCS